MDFFVTTSPGLEECLAAEVKETTGCDPTIAYGGVSLQGESRLLVDLNLWLSTALRVLVPLVEGRCLNGKELYRLVRGLDWSDYLAPSGSLAVSCVGRGSGGLEHTHYAALRVKDAIVDQFRDRFGERPNVNRNEPDLKIHCNLNDNHAIISLDSSGHSLHRRGYRTKSGPAAMRETLAAALIRYSGWNKKAPFVDFMCGSGTLPIEAARWAMNIAPGLQHSRFGYWAWKEGPSDKTFPSKEDHQTALEKLSPQSDDMPLILGFDKDPAMVEIARENAERAGVSDFVKFETRALEETDAFPEAKEGGVLMCNPPYGERMGSQEDLRRLYRAIGDLFKQKGQGYTGHILTGNTALAKSVGLRTCRRRPIWNGPLECRLLSYELYAGTRKKRAHVNPTPQT